MEWLSATAIVSYESASSDEVICRSASAMLIGSGYGTLVSCISLTIELTVMDSSKARNRLVGCHAVLDGVN